MRKILSFLLLISATMMSVASAFAQDPDKSLYDAAMEAITNGGTYRITTEVDGTKYYVTANGALTSVKSGGGIFTLNKSTGGALYNEGIEIAGANGHFSNTTLLNDLANLHPGTGVYRLDGGNNRNDWERQVFFLDEAGKYAIRSCNTAYGESSWNDAGRAFWTYEVADAQPDPCYTYDAAFVWSLESVVAVNVTYQLFETDGTKVGNPVVVKHAPGDGPIVPASLANNYIYEYSIDGTIGNEDCEIAITRSIKEEVVTDLADLNNEKAYLIRCDRGALLTKDGYLASTAHSTLTKASASEFAVISYDGNYYLYSVADKKFVTNTGALADRPANGAADAIQIEQRNDWAAPYFMFYFNMENGKQYGLNTNGNDPYGYVINDWMTADAGNMYYMVAEADFDATEAMNALNGYVEVAIGQSGYASICYPKPLAVPEGVKAYTGVVNDSWLTLTEVEGNIPAGTAVVLKGESGNYKLTLTDEAEAVGDNDLKGTSQPLAADGSQYVLSVKDNTVGFYKAEGTIPAYKAYLEIEGSNVKGFTIIINGETAIESIATTTPADGAIYDLSGRRVEKATKGLYIINGKKVIIK